MIHFLHQENENKNDDEIEAVVNEPTRPEFYSLQIEIAAYQRLPRDRSTIMRIFIKNIK